MPGIRRNRGEFMEAGLMTGGCDGQIVITALMSGKMQTQSSDLTDRDSSLSRYSSCFSPLSPLFPLQNI